MADHTGRSDYKETIIVLVGGDKEQFTVHKDLICSNSPFFKAACSGAWTEGRDKTVQLPDHKPLAFKVYLEWSYSSTKDLATLCRTLLGPSLSKDEKTGPSDKLKSQACRSLCQLWVLSDYLGDGACKNEVINNLIVEIEENKIFITPTTIHEIVAGTQVESGLYRWLVDTFIAYITGETLQRYHGKLPQEFIFQVLKRFATNRGAPEKSERPKPAEARQYYDSVGSKGDD